MASLYSDVTVMVPAMVSVDEGGGMVQVCVELNAMEATQREFSVTLTTSDDSGILNIYDRSNQKLIFAALVERDYTDISSILTFANNSMAGDMECVNVTIIDDDALEIDETFTVTLTTSDFAVILDNDVTVITITDDDG